MVVALMFCVHVHATAGILLPQCCTVMCSNTSENEERDNKLAPPPQSNTTAFEGVLVEGDEMMVNASKEKGAVPVGALILYTAGTTSILTLVNTGVVAVVAAFALA